MIWAQVLKKNTAELRAYHEEHPDGLPAIFSFLDPWPAMGIDSGGIFRTRTDRPKRPFE